MCRFRINPEAWPFIWCTAIAGLYLGVQFGFQYAPVVVPISLAVVPLAGLLDRAQLEQAAQGHRSAVIMQYLAMVALGGDALFAVWLHQLGLPLGAACGLLVAVVARQLYAAGCKRLRRRLPAAGHGYVI